MLTACEDITKMFLPAMKAAIAKKLHEVHNFTQVEIAGELGVTQAAISKYIAGDYSNEIKRVERGSTVQKMSVKIAEFISKGRKKRAELIDTVCKSCMNIRGANSCDYKDVQKLVNIIV
mgnify:CR=1 FL=1